MDSKDFSENYRNIVQFVENDFLRLDDCFENHFGLGNASKNQIIPIIKDYFSTKGKRIRSALIFLLVRALKKDIDDEIIKLALAEELIHNATLIHDDIIDCSLIRRGKKTLNFEHDTKLAVLAGDYLLTEAMILLSSFGKGGIFEEIRFLHTSCLSGIINGELQQYFNRFKGLSIEQYIEKSKAKTAKLFEAGLVSSYIMYCSDKQNRDEIKNFAINFGIAFQIKNDLDNLNSSEKINEDIENGDYSAPIIYYIEEKKCNDFSNIKNSNGILKKLKTTNALEKTRQLLRSYIDLAIENLTFLEDNLYKQALIDLCKLFTE